jgi:hypothetical protein
MLINIMAITTLLEENQKLLLLCLLIDVMLDRMSVRMKVAPNTRIR